MDPASTSLLMNADEGETAKTTEILVFYLRANMKHLERYEDALEKYGII